MQKRREIEATTVGNGNGKTSCIPYGMSLISSGLNMTTCVKHCQHFFRRYRGIHEDVQVVAYWMMAGYLGPASSFGEAFEKGRDIRYDIKSSTKCKHEGFCILHNIGFIDLLYLDSGVNDTNRVQFRKDDTTKILELRLKRMAYLADYEPTPESLSKMLAYQHPKSKEKANNLNVLLIRGCKFLSPSSFLSNSTTNFKSLTVVEISSSPCSPMDIGIISELTHLECLNLSDLPNLEMLPDHLFHKLRSLRWLIVRGCSNLRSLPSTEVLTKLVVLDLSHCTSLPVFLDIRYPQLQVLDLSYTSTVYGLRGLSTPKLTHLFLRGLNLKNLLIFSQLYNLQVLDLFRCEKLVHLSPFMNVPSLKHLNLCGCASFADFHESLFDQMSGLVDLDLSGTKVKYLPSTFTCLTSLQNLSLRGLQLQTLASLPIQLLKLDLAGMGKLPDVSNLVNLEKLILADCQQMDVVPNLEALTKLEELDLSRCPVEKLPDMSKLLCLKKLLLADCRQLKVVPDLKYCQLLKELDFSGLQIRSMEDFNLDFLKSLRGLKSLNLSRSFVEKLPDLSELIYLDELLLADCPRLNVVPSLPSMHLKTLDLSLPNDSTIENRQLKFGIIGFPFPSSLRKLVLTNRSGLRELFPNNNLRWLKLLDLRGTDVVNCDSILKEPVFTGEIHALYGTKSHQPSGSDSEVVDLENVSSTHELDSLNIEAFQLQLKKLHRDLRNKLLENINNNNNSPSRKRRKAYLLQLIDAVAAHPSFDSNALQLLSRVIVTLKRLLPPTTPNLDSIQQSLHLFISRFLKLQLPAFFDYFQKICEEEGAVGGNGIKSVDEQQGQRPYGPWLGSVVNMTGRFKDHRGSLKGYANSIDWDVLIAYWMMVGYVGPARSFWEAYWKGWDVLLAGSSLTNPIQCILQNLTFFHLLDPDLDSRSSVDSDVNFQTYQEDTSIKVLTLQRIAYLVAYRPTLDSFNKMLGYQHTEANNLSTLLIRGCEFWSHSTNYLNSLTVLEISSLSTLISPMDIEIISELTRLESLNLSHLSGLETLPNHLFNKLTRLRQLILIGCSKLCSLPSIDGLTNLVVLDLSHCTSLHHPFILDIRYPHLQVLDLSYTPIVWGFRELLTPKLTHLSLRGSNLKNLLIFNKMPYLVKLDISGTKVKHLPSFTCLTSLQNLSLRGLQLDLTGMGELQLDLTGLKSCKRLTELDLSSSSMDKLPDMSRLSWLEKLFLADCRQLKVVPDLKACKMLTELDLSGLQIPSMEDFNLDFLKSHWRLEILNLSRSSVEKLPDLSGLENLKKLLLADCPRLRVVPDLESCIWLTKLDLSGLQIHSMEDFNLDFLKYHWRLEILNLSRSSVEKLPDLSGLENLKKLLLADCPRLRVVPDLESCIWLTELDLSGLQIHSMEDFNLDFLKYHWKLEILNLSRSSVEKLPDLSGLENLKKLLLADCPRLNVVPDLSHLFYLTTLDLSLPDDSLINNHQLKFGTQGQWDQGSFPLPQSLRKLVLTNRSGLQELFPNNILSELEVLDLRGTDVVDYDSFLEAHVKSSTEIHAIYGTKSHQSSEVDHFDDVSRELDTLISDFQNHMATINTDHHRLKKLLSDLRYIQKNIEGIKNNSRDSHSLLELKDAATDLSLARFTVDSTAFKLLDRLVFKLKGLVPRTRNQKYDSKAFQITKKKKSSLRRSTNKENIDIVIAEEMPGMDLVTCYNSLSDLEKQWLLCFSVFPFNEDDGKSTCALKSLVIRKKMLIYWWVGEGFIVPKNWESRGSIEEIGKQILEVLVKYNFIEPMIRKGRESTSYYYMRPFVHSFVIKRAMEENFFDIDQETCNLTQIFAALRGPAC